MVLFSALETTGMNFAKHCHRTILLSFVFICVCLWFSPSLGTAQEAGQEVVANLAAGRVVIYVARDGIVVGTVEQRLEPGSRPPLVIPLGERRIGILLGAAEWSAPALGQPPVQLDRELPRLAAESAPRRLQDDSFQASDIESLGVAFLERLRVVAGQLHSKLDLQPDEPLAELLLVGYTEQYGPEVWNLRYRVVQEVLRGNFWRTRVMRPSYTQLYPPEKGQPRTLIEVRYPPEGSDPTLLELLQKNDPRLSRLRIADPQMIRATEHVARGETHKAPAADAAAFLRAALPIIAEPDANLVLGIIREESGLEWILAPPEPLEKADKGKPREPGAPTLRKKRP